MTAEELALAALGLRRGATRAQVDKAYRRLMKAYHPDRTGGDGRRAAEINRAYTMLKRQSPQPPPRRVKTVVIRQPPKRRGAPLKAWLAILGLGAAAVVGLVSGDWGQDRRGAILVWPNPVVSAQPMPLVQAVDFDEPINESVIASSIADAEKFNESGDLSSAAQYSQVCHDRLRQHPNLILFDACAAFDESIFILNADNPIAASGPFDSQAVVAREVGSARSFSGDVFEVDTRIRQIRSMVEYRLLPKIDGAADLRAP